MSDTDWTWIRDHQRALGEAVQEHLAWSGLAFAMALAAVLVLMLVARRWRSLDRALRGVAIVAATLPMVAFVAVFNPSSSNRGWLVGVAAASVTALMFRNVMLGLDRVDPVYMSEATALGFGRLRRLVQVDLALSRRHVRGALEIGALSAIGQIAVAGVVLDGGLGQFIRDGFTVGPPIQRVAGIGTLVVLAVVVDVAVRLVVRRPSRPMAT
jgi:osmoprotectant transport system permease protein